MTAAAESDPQRVYELAAELFSVMATPMRLRIISALCHGEKNVSQLLGELGSTQPNMSQHLNHLWRAGILGRRRDGAQVFYSIRNQKATMLCRAVCTQIAIEIDDPSSVEPAERLVSANSLGL